MPGFTTLTGRDYGGLGEHDENQGARSALWDLPGRSNHLACRKRGSHHTEKNGKTVSILKKKEHKDMEKGGEKQSKKEKKKKKDKDEKDAKFRTPDKVKERDREKERKRHHMDSGEKGDHKRHKVR